MHERQATAGRGVGAARHAGWALVTGASMGIGEAFARALAARGHDLVLCARSADRLHALAAEIRAAHGVQVHVSPADLSRPGEAARMWADAVGGRTVAMLVNNAGFGLMGRLDELPLERQSEMVALNCTAVLELAHLAVRHMRPRGAGSVLNVASIVAFQPVPYMATYAATKAFVLSLSEALADENREAGLRVIAVCPGPTPSGFQAVAGTRVSREQPGYLLPEQVVASALAALDAGKTHVVPGAMNRAASFMGRLLPLRTSARVAGRVVRKRG